MLSFLFGNTLRRGIKNERRRAARTKRLRTCSFEILEHRALFAAQPFGAVPDDTGEFMLGDVYVSVVFLESSTQTSSTNNNSETWTAATIAAAKQNIQDGLQWWEDTLAGITSKHSLNFEIDFTYADNPVTTNYEPITRSSNDYRIWMYDFLRLVGYNTTGNEHSDIKAYNHAQRLAHDTDWAFTIFVVNDENDSDHQFAPGGFSRAFAFAGGEFFVSLGSRPSSTYSHEAGHIFWGLDEYQPDGSYNRFRGYYNTQNLNSWDNPTSGFTQQPSIMTNGSRMDTAYSNHTSPASTLAMIGWQDSDGDGVFDVSDVPLTLTGSGFFDAAAGQYRFTGVSSVQALINKNSSGLQNDISINKVSRAQYRMDGGAWQTAATYGDYEAFLDLRIPVISGATSLEIRTIDDVTGITSSIFQAALDRPRAVPLPGLNGVVWQDIDRDGLLDSSERGLAGVTLQLVNSSGQPITLETRIEPDDHPSTTRLNTVSSKVTLSAYGSGAYDDTVASYTAAGSTGARAFAARANAQNQYVDFWDSNRQFRMDFTAPVSTLALDAIGTTVPGYGRLEVYGANNQLLARYTTDKLAQGQVETMQINRPTADIKYAIARGHSSTAIRLDNLRFGPQATATTDENGTFALPYLNAGSYSVRVVANGGQTPTNPSSGTQSVIVAEGEFLEGVDFGLVTETSRWQNPVNRFDTNGDGFVAPIDVLNVINKINRDGSRALNDSDTTPPFVDVNGDFQVSSLDALQIINELNRGGGSGGGEGESGFASSMSSWPAWGADGAGEAAEHFDAGQPYVIPATEVDRLMSTRHAGQVDSANSEDRLSPETTGYWTASESTVGMEREQVSFHDLGVGPRGHADCPRELLELETILNELAEDILGGAEQG